jgi:hypothetical protein
VLSDAKPYQGWRGLVPIARDASDFLEIVQWAVANQDQVRRSAAELRRRVLGERDIRNHLDRWREAVVGSREDAPLVSAA